MTTEEFKLAVQKIIDGDPTKYNNKSWDNDPEVGHLKYDELLEQVLRELGYGDGIDLSQDHTKWYA